MQSDKGKIAKYYFLWSGNIMQKKSISKKGWNKMKIGQERLSHFGTGV